MIRLLLPAAALALMAPPAAAQQLPRRAQLGVTMPAGRQQGQGAGVGEVVPGATAAALGVRSGDLITGFNGRPIARPPELVAAGGSPARGTPGPPQLPR